jgi:MFS family permease
MGSLMVGPIVSGPMAQTVGWRNFWWLNVGILAFSFLLVVFGFPETKWHRVHIGEPVSTPPNEVKTEQPNEKAVQLEQQPVENPQDPWLGRGGPKKMQWALFQPNAHPFRSILLDLWIPWKMMAFPIVQFASFVVSWSCSSFLTINLTQTQAFAPRGFSSLEIGFMNFAILIGAMIGLATAGPLSDWVSARATAKNNGIREPEMRLPAMIPYVIIMYLGNIVVSVGYEKQWPWAAIVVVGYTCAGIQVAALP